MQSGNELRIAAQKKLQGKAFLSFFLGGPNYDEAADLFMQAANRYKMEKNWKDSSDCFSEAANVYQKSGDQTRHISCLMEAGHAAKKYSLPVAKKYYEASAEAYNVSGRFGQSARAMKGIAELYESENNFLEALKYYKRAAEYFDMDEYGKSSYTMCILKFAEYTARYEENISEAIKIFENEAEKALRNSLIQFGAKEHFLKAGILRLVQKDAVDAKIALENYEALDHKFSTSREAKLLRNLVTATEEENEEAFLLAIQEFDNITRLDPWKVHFLYKIRETFSKDSGAVQALAQNYKERASTEEEIDLT